MYLAQPDARPAVIHGPHHELAEAMRRGCLIYPVQLNGLGGMEAIPQIGAACVMGAAAAGGWTINRHAADESWGPRGRCHVCGKDESWSLAAHLNNFHGLPREQIADWLDAIR